MFLHSLFYGLYDLFLNRVILLILILLVIVPLFSIGYSNLFLRIVSLEKSLKVSQKITKEQEKTIFFNFKKNFTHRFKDVELNSPYTWNGVKEEEWLRVVNLLKKRKSWSDRIAIFYFIIPWSIFFNIKESRRRMTPLLFFMTMFLTVYFGNEAFITQLWYTFMLYFFILSVLAVLFSSLVDEEDGFLTNFLKRYSLTITDFYIILGNPLSTIGRTAISIAKTMLVVGVGAFTYNQLM